MLTEVLAGLSSAVRADGATAGAAMQAVWRAVQEGGAQAADEAAHGIAPLFDGLPPGRGSRLAVLAGALVERGAAPGPVLGPVVDGWLATAQDAAQFAARWKDVVGLEPPEPAEDAETFGKVVARLAGEDAAADDVAGIRRIAGAWFVLGQWTLPLTTFLQRADGRREMPRRDEVQGVLDEVAKARYDVDYLVDLLRVLDDETLLVIDRTSARGFEVTIGGIGDNFQLHTLLADALIHPEQDGYLGGLRPSAEEVAAATTGPLRPERGMNGYFTLVDRDGHWIWNEGVPADIPLLDGRRLVVLDPPAERRTWEAGRQFEQMVPTLRVDRLVPPAQTADWIVRVPFISTPPPHP